MKGMFMLLLTAAVFGGSESLKLSGALPGGSWKVLQGFHQAFCKAKKCEITVLTKKTIQGCARACVNRNKCRCAMYRPADNYCALKKYHCMSPKTSLRKDPKKMHYAIDVTPKRNRAPTPAPVGRDGGSPTGDVFRSTMTIFHGFGIPYGGCGVPQTKTVDANGKLLPYVALNVNSKILADGNGDFDGLFQNGNNCGRWLKITIGKPCGGSNDGSNIDSCLANYNSGQGDGKEGKVVYGYVSDSCADRNGWCLHDKRHVDMGIENMKRLGLDKDWKNNRIEWQFLSSTPPGWVQTGKVKYYWAEKAKKEGFLCIIATGLTNGISSIQSMHPNGTWLPGWKNWILGQQWSLQPEIKTVNGKYVVRTLDVSGRSYGTTYVDPPTGSTEVTAAH